jgi:hypothetical protein
MQGIFIAIFATKPQRHEEGDGKIYASFTLAPLC